MTALEHPFIMQKQPGRRTAYGLLVMLAAAVPTLVSIVLSDWSAALVSLIIFMIGLALFLDGMYRGERRLVIHADGISLIAPWRVWRTQQRWAWNEVIRLDLTVTPEDLVNEREAQARIGVLLVRGNQCHYETLSFNSDVAEAIIRRAKLQPQENQSLPRDLSALNLEKKHTWSWAR
ncbi:MAG TPA: hypothetical protein EYP04_12190 [Anaerolineae bacterium]|nr:hypothetical protein [Anaerolineae bacterium]